MSNQLQITGGAKVRNLEGVLTGTSGVVSSLGINVPSGIPQLDGSGKILVSQLPNSVMEYKGTWDASTNTPTLVDGTGNAGDVYLCNVAGTVNFGAGPITFYVGDQVLYSGTVWQRASGATGSVTSVALTESGDALNITGSPITTSGTINIGFAGSSTQYIAGNGTLVTFPSIISEAQNLVTEVYNSSGATIAKGSVVYINGGQGNLPTITKAQANTEVASNQTIGLVRADITNMNNGYVTVAGRLENLDTQAYSVGTTLYLSPSVAGGYTSTKPTSPDHIVYVGVIVRSHPTQGVIEVKIQNTQELNESADVLISSPANNEGLFYESSTSLWKNKTIANVLGYTPLGGSGTAGNVPYYTAANTLGSENGFMYDSSTNRFGVNTTVPNATIGANASIDSGYSLLLKNADANYNGIGFGINTTYGNTFETQKLGVANAMNLTLLNQSGYISLTEGGNLGINILSPIASPSGIGSKGIDIYGDSQAASIGFHNVASGTGNTNGAYIYLLNAGGLTIRNLEGAITSSSLGDFSVITNGTENFRVNSSDGSIYQSNVANAMLKTVSGVLTAAVAGTDYVAPSALSSYVPTSRTITINGTTQDLSANRSWSVGTVTGGGASGRLAFWDSASNIASDSVLNWDDTNNRLLVGTSTSVKTVTIYSSTADSQLIISGNAPSVNLTEALSGTILYQAKFGLATAANNYSTGSVAGDFVISSQTGSTIFAYNSTEAMRVDTSRNVGIGGIARSGYRLHVYDTAPLLGIESTTTGNVALRFLQAGTVVSGITYFNSDSTLRITNNNGGVRFGTGSVDPAMTITNAGNVGINTSGSTTSTPHLFLGTNLSMFNGGSDDSYFGSNFYFNSAWYYRTSNAASMIQQNGGEIVFKNAASGTANAALTWVERMRITSGGDIQYGITPAKDTRLIWKNSSSGQVSSQIWADGGPATRVYTGTTSTPTGVVLYDGATSWSSGSDIRLKNVTGNIENALEKLMHLNGVYFTWKTDEKAKSNVGIIAQDVLEVLPEVVTEDHISGMLHVAYQEMIPLLINAIKEQQAQIDELKAKIN